MPDGEAVCFLRLSSCRSPTIRSQAEVVTRHGLESALKLTAPLCSNLLKGLASSCPVAIIYENSCCVGNLGALCITERQSVWWWGGTQSAYTQIKW